MRLPWLTIIVWSGMFLFEATAVDAFQTTNAFARKSSLPPSGVLHSSPLPSEEDSITVPSPGLSAVDVVNICMEALKAKKSTESLEICFNFSSDRCRAAVGGSLDEFVQYAANPVFGRLINCNSYEILKIGPVIPGGPHRGEMQTFLIGIEKPVTVQDAIKAGKTKARKRPTLEERLRQRQMEAGGEAIQEGSADDSRKFLWTLQKERRPPRQNCWLVHEVLFTQNAGMITV